MNFSARLQEHGVGCSLNSEKTAGFVTVHLSFCQLRSTFGVFHSYQINTAKGILDTILNVQPKEGGGGGGETRESIVYRLADDMLEKLPKQYNNFEVCVRA